MADSVRELILKNVQTTLQGITTGDGYSATLASVRRYLQSGQVYANVPAVEILEGDDDVTAEGPLAGAGSLVTRTLNIGLLLIHRQDEAVDLRSASEVMNALIADIQKAMQVDFSRGGHALDTDETSVSPIFAEEGQPELACEIAYVIKYRHRRDDPTQET